MPLRPLTVLPLIFLLLSALTAAHEQTAAGTGVVRTHEAAQPSSRWAWPLRVVRVTRAFAAPPHVYGAGHRGVDLAAREGTQVVAPASGIIVFVGVVVDRGVVTIDHGDGYVTTLEPVVGSLVPGTVVDRGDTVATVSVGGHAQIGELHFGVRLHGEYINPLALLGGIPRAVLLPCC